MKFAIISLLFIVVSLSVAAESVASQQAPPPGAPVVKVAPVRRVDPTDGAKMYLDLCASCHGKDGTGNGPAAPALKVPSPSLVTIAKAHGGKFSYADVEDAINGKTRMMKTPAHGTIDMPIWGRGQFADNAALAIRNIVAYLESIQVK